MKPVTSYFLGVATVLMVSAAVAMAAVPRPLAWRDTARGPQISGLSAAQHATLTNLHTQTLSQRRDAHARIGALIETARDELSHPDADLAALSSQAEATLLPLILEARVQRQSKLDFYNTLNPSQQAEVRAWLQRRLGRVERLHAVTGDFLNDNP
jgi:Spy/CpxP family protein refolding chaperone